MITVLKGLTFLKGLKFWHVAAAVLVTWSTYVGVKAYNMGGVAVATKIERANNVAITKANDVGRKSLDPAARGVRDPYFRGN